jgi:hypothetical protein
MGVLVGVIVLVLIALPLWYLQRRGDHSTSWDGRQARFDRGGGDSSGGFGGGGGGDGGGGGGL